MSQNNNFTQSIFDITQNLTQTKEELQLKLDQCFQSASEGKKKIAAALTGKGIATNDDATYETLADNITSISTSANIKLLGGLGTYNLQSLGIKNWSDLSSDNFIIEAISFDGGGGSKLGYGGIRVWQTTFSKNYNHKTGIFSCNENKVATTWDIDNNPPFAHITSVHNVSVRVWVIY